MNISLEYYRIFYYVAKLGAITAAANELFISQPAVSKAVKQLEGELRAALFYRTSRGVTLTPEGEALFSHVARGYESIKLGESKLSELLNLEAGEIKIGASDMTLRYYLLPYLEEFHRAYPKIKVKVTNAPTPVTLSYLEAGKIDFGVVTSPAAYRYGFVTTPVRQIRDIFVAGSQFNAIRNKPLSPCELSELPIICLEPNTSTREYLNGYMTGHGAAFNPEFELATSDLIVSFAVRSLGIGCVVSDFARDELDHGRLFTLRLDPPIPPREICVIVSDRLAPSPAGKKLLSMLV